MDGYSLLAFNIKSKKMIEKLEEIGFEFELTDENTITEFDTIITPDGEKIVPEVELCETYLYSLAKQIS